MAPTEPRHHDERKGIRRGPFPYSTPRDYVRLQQMLLGRGGLGGVRILDAATVDDAFVNQIGEL